MISKLVSGGQTGVDRAALDTALELAFSCGGWCPKGRRAEDGPLDEIYPLQETPSARYPQRTEWNVRDSDGTLVLYRQTLTGGSAYTVELAKRYDRPCLVLDLSTNPTRETILNWVNQHQIHVLNVAGSRENGNPGIYEQGRQLLRAVLSSPA
ncbi:MAG: putative molybdenum carrier protein [Acidobacteriota bacterium]